MRDAPFVLRVASLLAFSYGLLGSVNSIPLLGVTELLGMFGRTAASAFFGIAPGLALLLVFERHLPSAWVRRWAALAGSVVLAAACATTLQIIAALALRVADPPLSVWDWAEVASSELVWIVLVAAWREALSQRQATIAALHESELRSVDLQAQIAEAELQMLQAQIEPHFLFNSLANVRRLGCLDMRAGKAMLADLLQYLQQTLPRLRESDSTLAREAEVARSFLAVHKIRMGDRLDVEFAIPEDLGATPVPPMMLLTLVENALKHGLAPLSEGGRIRVAAQHEDGALRLSVADTGRGIVPGRGAGNGLANIRARLRSLHGARASLSLEMNMPRGVVAVIVLPLA
ncbi:MAG: histidine kinase [Gemmatimonadota bacterium]|nr:histidine kinase [Gemmatimonadota bacterium]